jgi:hypothetical protein
MEGTSSSRDSWVSKPYKVAERRMWAELNATAMAERLEREREQGLMEQEDSRASVIGSRPSLSVRRRLQRPGETSEWRQREIRPGSLYAPMAYVLYKAPGVKEIVVGTHDWATYHRLARVKEAGGTGWSQLFDWQREEDRETKESLSKELALKDIAETRKLVEWAVAQRPFYDGALFVVLVRFKPNYYRPFGKLVLDTKGWQPWDLEGRVQRYCDLPPGKNELVPPSGHERYGLRKCVHCDRGTKRQCGRCGKIRQSKLAWSDAPAPD